MRRRSGTMRAGRSGGRRAVVVVVSALASLGAVAGRAAADEELEQRIARVESGLPAVTVEGEAALELTLSRWMEALRVPAVSIAVIDDGRIAWARGYGVREAGTDDPVTAETLFQAASISKPVTAVAVLHHVERGALDLDAPINGILRSWSLPDGESAPASEVTLRRLLAHTAGITPGGFTGYAAGEPRPGTVQILEGETPATNPPARIVAPPGSAVAYSGLGYTMLELALADRLEKAFPRIVEDAVLRPLGMVDSAFEQPLSPALAARAASGHRANGAVVDGRWAIHPELAAAGLWTTPTDLAKLAIDVARSRAGEPGRVLSPEMTRRMLTPEMGTMGLGFVVRRDDETGYFAHSGGNQGYRCHMEMLAAAGQGVVVMTSSDSGQPLARLIVASVAREYGWPLAQRAQISDGLARELRQRVEAGEVGRVEIELEPETLARYVGRYELAPDLVFDVTLHEGRLHVQLGDQPRFPVFPESPTRFFYRVVDAQISFVVSGSGEVSALVLHQGGRDQEARRIE